MSAPFADRLGAVRARIEAAAAGRPVALLAVSKGFGPDAVAEAQAAGLAAFGENYAQELVPKAAACPGVTWHFIGAIQRNKVASLARVVTVWQTVDRPAVVAAIARHAPGAAVFVEVNLAGEPGRGGCSFADAPALVEAAHGAGLDVRGLMGIGPADADPKPAFAALAALRERLQLAELSIGMSGDLEAAIEAGSTMVRVGSALFGPRPSAPDLRR